MRGSTSVDRKRREENPFGTSLGSYLNLYFVIVEEMATSILTHNQTYIRVTSF